MSNLPTSKITQATAFERVGVEFAGPFNIKSNLRCHTFTKSYLALFICLTTKAVHLEKVDGLITEDFIATLRRFLPVEDTQLSSVAITEQTLQVRTTNCVSYIN